MDDGLETSEIPTLVFGGRSKLRYATALILTLNRDQTKTRAWVRSVADAITYGMSPVNEAVVIAFTATGLQKVGLTEDEMKRFPTAFQSGMVSPGRSRALGDVGGNDPEGWGWGSAERPCDAILVLYATTEDDLAGLVSSFTTGLDEAGCGAPYSLALTLSEMKQAPEANRKPVFCEPFGFADGLSQPVLRGTTRAGRNSNPAHLMAAGEFVLGYDTNAGNRKISPFVSASRDPQEMLPVVRSGSGIGYRDLGRNGTFLVVRQLEQDVDKFKSFVSGAAAELGAQGALPPGLAPAEQEDRVAAKMFGRWQNGSPLVRYPDRPGPSRDNDFLYAAEDPFGMSCPLGAHIRRANPRDSLLPGVIDPLTISNTHRLLRVGRPYQPQGKLVKPGILFMCLNADIELQFEVVQQTWLLRTDFHGLRNESDPITGRRANEARHYTVPTPEGPVQLKDLADFVTVKGGAYFFMPSRAAMAFLGS